MATAADFTARDWTVKDSTAPFLLKKDRIEFAYNGKQLKVRVYRARNTVAIGVAKLADGGLNATFHGRVGQVNVPFVAVRFDLDGGTGQLAFKVHPILDAGIQPDQGGSAGGSGGSSGTGTGGGTGGGGSGGGTGGGEEEP